MSPGDDVSVIFPREGEPCCWRIVAYDADFEIAERFPIRHIFRDSEYFARVEEA